MRVGTPVSTCSANKLTGSVPLPGGARWYRNRWQKGASNLRARARRSGGECESCVRSCEGTANEVTVERERIESDGRVRVRAAVVPRP